MANDAEKIGIPASVIPLVPDEAGVEDLLRARDLLQVCQSLSATH
jgi:hypothetical protein